MWKIPLFFSLEKFLFLRVSPLLPGSKENTNEKKQFDETKKCLINSIMIRQRFKGTEHCHIWKEVRLKLRLQFFNSNILVQRIFKTFKTRFLAALCASLTALCASLIELCASLSALSVHLYQRCVHLYQRCVCISISAVCISNSAVWIFNSAVCIFNSAVCASLSALCASLTENLDQKGFLLNLCQKWNIKKKNTCLVSFKFINVWSCKKFQFF